MSYYYDIPNETNQSQNFFLSILVFSWIFAKCDNVWMSFFLKRTVEKELFTSLRFLKSSKSFQSALPLL